MQTKQIIYIAIATALYLKRGGIIDTIKDWGIFQ